MEDKKTTNMEEETLNQQQLSDTTDEEEVKKTVDRETKYKELQSNADRGVQKILQEAKQKENELENTKKFYDLVLQETGKVAEDGQRLVDLYYENPDVANELLNRYYGGDTIENYATTYGYQLHNEKNIDLLAEKKAKDIIEQQKVTEKIDNFIRAMAYDEATEQIFKAELEDIVGNKKIDSVKVDKYLLMAHTYLKKDEYNRLKDLEKEVQLAKAQASGGGESKTESSKSKDARSDEVISFLRSMGL